MRVRIVHERFTELGGSEMVVEQLLRAFPDSDVFVPIHYRSGFPLGIPPERVRTSPLQHLYRGDGTYAPLLPLLPGAMRRADFSGIDAVITSHHAFSQRIEPPADIPWVSYVHSPARWMWDSTNRVGEPGGRLGSAGLAAFSMAFRERDRQSAQRPHQLVANSTAVADRIRRWWGRESLVVPPPVRTHRFSLGAESERGDFFLLAGRLVPYKRPEVAISAARRAGVRLVVAGAGRHLERCRAFADDEHVEFLGRVDDDTMLALMQQARALLFPGEEDFGIIPVEAMSCGTPVIALARGGALDYVRDGVSGVLVDPPSLAHDAVAVAFADVLRSFDDTRFDRVTIRGVAEGFSEEAFRSRMQEIVASTAAA